MKANSKWIWPVCEAGVDQYGEFYQAFLYAGQKAQLSISADSNYAVYVNGVKGAALSVPGQDDRVADALQNDTVVVEFRLVDGGAEELLRKRAGADDDKLRVGFAGGVFFGENREFDAGRLREVGAQFVRGGLLDGRRGVRKNDRVIGATVFR